MTTTKASKVFLFEYATCGEGTSPHIAIEGLAMFKTLYDGFQTAFKKVIVETRKGRESYNPINTFVRKDFSEFFDLPVSDNWLSDFKSFSEGSDFGLTIAPEDDGILFELTKEMEKRTENLGSDSKAVYTASNKWLTFKEIKGKVKTPQTVKIDFHGSSHFQKPLKDHIIELIPENSNFREKILIKPQISCGGSGMKLLSHTGKIGGLPDNFNGKFIAQEFIKGINVSVSFLIGSEIVPISINEQILDNFNFIGIRIPPRELEIDKDSKKEILDESTGAIESLKGLFGYVGVDLVVNDSGAYVVDINPRITTSAVLLGDAYGINLSELLIENYFKEKINLTDKIKKCSNTVLFKKIKNELSKGAGIRVNNNISDEYGEKNNTIGYEYLSANGYSIIKYNHPIRNVANQINKN